MSSTSHPVPPQVDVLERRAFVGGAAGLIASLMGALVSPTQFFHSYLFAFLFWNGIALGCLSLLMIQHLTGGRWGLAIRRLLEAGTRTVPVLVLLFLPVVLGLKRIYPWAGSAQSDPTIRHAIDLKQAYLNVPFFLGRAVFYFAVWFLLARVLSRVSLDSDTGMDLRRARLLRSISGGGLLLMGLTITFMSVDWAMSLDPRWFSAIYGMLFMIGQALSALALCIVVISRIGMEPPLSAVANADTLHDLGKLMLAFIMVWAYFSFSQFLITWSGNLPEEIPWYLRRFQGGWRLVGLFLVVFHFAVPFLVLLSRGVKRRAKAVGTVALAILAVRIVDLFWLVRPEFPHAGLDLHWLDFTLPIGIGGVWLGVFARQLKTRPLLPLGEPEVREMLAEAGA
ncbi:MAG: hypothetical protein DMF77_03375 [Acidobacteria bacterium]|nr:MAG: hypothetical protein DMF77_03375 [Acidobacteriota bacterium]